MSPSITGNDYPYWSGAEEGLQYEAVLGLIVGLKFGQWFRFG
jgi:hypothetical protein